MDTISAYNLQRPPFEAAKIMVYFEKHNLMEIIRRLMLEMGMKRPANIQKFINKNIKRIANDVNTSHTFLLAPSIFDFQALSKYMHKHHNIPTVFYTKEREGCDTEKILKKFKKFIKQHNLEKKNIIFVNFPSNRAECLQFRKERISPEYVFEIIPTTQVPFKTRQMLQAEGSQYLSKVKQIKSFYEKVYRAINYGTPDDPDKCSNQDFELYRPSIQEVGLEIIKMLRNIDANPDECAIGKFLPRIFILGRKGSGRRTQAKMLANLFDLIFIDMEELIARSMTEETPLALALEHASSWHCYADLVIASVLHKRLLEPDCLRCGWVVVGYPNNVEDFKKIEKFLVPPNKIVFIHCRERVCFQRLRHFWDKNPNFKATEVAVDECTGELNYKQIPRADLEQAAQKEFLMFNLAKNSLLNYLSKKKEIIHIDGNHTRQTVASKISANIEKRQRRYAITRSYKERRQVQESI